MTKFLFREESVGPEMWSKKHIIIKTYFEVTKDPWFSKDENITLAYFNMALMELEDRGLI